MKPKRSLLSITFTPTFRAPDRKTGAQRLVVPKVPGTGRYEYSWDDGSKTYPYWIASGCSARKNYAMCGEPYLWLVRSADIGGFITISQEVLTDALNRGLKHFETNVYPIVQDFYYSKALTKQLSIRHRLYLPSIAFDLRRRVILSYYDPQIRVDLAEMEVIS